MARAFGDVAHATYGVSRGVSVRNVAEAVRAGRAVTWPLGTAEPGRTPVHFVHVQTSAPSYLLEEIGRQKWEHAGEAILDAPSSRPDTSRP